MTYDLNGERTSAAYWGSYLNPDKPSGSSSNPNFISGASFNFGYTKISGNYPGTQPSTRRAALRPTMPLPTSCRVYSYGVATVQFL